MRLTTNGQDTTSTQKRSRPHTRHPRHRGFALGTRISITLGFESLTLQVFQSAGLNSGYFKNQQAGGQQETEFLPLQTAQQITPRRYNIGTVVWKVPGVYMKKIYLLTSECVLKRQRALGDFFKNRRAGRCRLFSLSQPSQPDTCRNKHKHLTPTLLTPHTLPHVLLCICPSSLPHSADTLPKWLLPCHIQKAALAGTWVIPKWLHK